MNLILLGGNSFDNKNWIEEIELTLKPYFESTRIQYYDHWQSGSRLIDLDKEVNKLASNIESTDECIIFAKSAGSLVSLKAIFERKISPLKCIFLGIPLNWAKKSGFDIDKWAEDFNTPLLIIQHIKDPLASATEVANFLKKEGIINSQLIELSGDTHDYEELDRIKDLVINFCKD